MLLQSAKTKKNKNKKKGICFARGSGVSTHSAGETERAVPGTRALSGPFLSRFRCRRAVGDYGRYRGQEAQHRARFSVSHIDVLRNLYNVVRAVVVSAHAGKRNEVHQ